jgi:hypothetical protein
MNVPAPTGYHDVIVRAAQDPNFDMDKLERLVELQENLRRDFANQDFNESMSAAQGEMSPISANANNPQTRSRYATYDQVDRECRPIYTKHGFAISYDTEEISETRIRVIGLVSHGSIVRRHQITMPIVTQGIRGGDMMTLTHATQSAVTYGKRALLGMIFNLAIDRDDDGNRAGGRVPPQQQAVQPQPVEPLHDPETGELMPPHTIAFDDSYRNHFQPWGAQFAATLRAADDEITLDRWLELNKETLEKFKKQLPKMYARLDAAINEARNNLKLAASRKEANEKGVQQ